MKTMNNKRDAVLAGIVRQLRELGEDVAYIAANKVNLPIVDEEGNEGWLSVTVSVPMGADRGKEPYDGYGERESYEMKQRRKEEKAAERAANKAKKAAERKEKEAAKEEED